MTNQLLFDFGLTVELIQSKVSSAMNIELEHMLVSNNIPQARRGELVKARQISMKLSKEYTDKSLAFIGAAHGGRDHATVLHACKTISNLLDTNDPLITIPYLRSKKSIEIFLEQQRLIENRKQEDSIMNTEK